MRARVNMRGSGITGQTSQDFIADTDWRPTMAREYVKKDVMDLTNRSLYAESQNRRRNISLPRPDTIMDNTNDQMDKIKEMTQTLRQTV